MTDPLPIVLAGGGTGGHLMPGLAVARALRERGAGPITFVGTARGLEAKLVPASGYDLELITIGGLKGGSWSRRLATLAQLPRAVSQCAALLRQTRAQVVFGIGGYASGPMLAAAGLLRVPVVVLEVNAKTGLANRWAAPWVHSAAVNFPDTARDFRRAEVTGIPVRSEFFARLDPPTADPPLVLVTGGSQGARALNQAVEAMQATGPLPFRLRHQSGLADFIADMPAAMAAAALVVCRAGASTLGELAAARKPAILIPLPTAADQHQLRNAEAYARAGAAVLLDQRDLTPQRLQAEIEALLASPERCAAMSTAVAAFAHPDAAARIAGMVVAAAKKERGVR